MDAFSSYRGNKFREKGYFGCGGRQYFASSNCDGVFTRRDTYRKSCVGTAVVVTTTNVEDLDCVHSAIRSFDIEAALYSKWNTLVHPFD